MTEEHIILFQSYLENEMSSDERQNFEENLKNDPKLAEQFILFQSMKQHVAEREKNKHALAVLNEVSNEYRNQKKPKIKSHKMLYFVNAAVILLLVLAYFLLKKKTPVTPQQMFAEVYVAPAWPMERGSSEKGEIFATYFSGDKEKGLQDLRQTKVMTLDEKNYWLAELFIKEQEPDSTLKYIQRLNPIPQKNRDRILFIQSLSYVLKNDHPSLKKLYDNLPSDMDGYYRERLVELVR